MPTKHSVAVTEAADLLYKRLMCMPTATLANINWRGSTEYRLLFTTLTKVAAGAERASDDEGLCAACGAWNDSCAACDL